MITKNKEIMVYQKSGEIMGQIIECLLAPNNQIIGLFNTNNQELDNICWVIVNPPIY